MAAMADQVVCSATNFLTGIMIGRACSKTEFGAYSLGMSIVLLLGAFQAGIILTPYMIRIPRLNGDVRNQYTGSILVHEAALCALAVVCLAVIAGVLVGTGARELVPVISSLAAVVPFLLLREHARQVCFARLQMGAALALDCCVGAAQLTGLTLLAYHGQLSAVWACWSLGAANLLAVSIWAFWFRGQTVLRPAQVLVDLRSNWSFGKWVFASSMIWALVTYLSPWILVSFHGTASAGIWAACLGTVSFVNPLVVGVQNFIGPTIAHACVQNDYASPRRHAVKAAAVSALILAPVALTLFIFGGSLAAIIYGDKYAGNGLIIAGLTLSVLLGATDFAFSRVLYAFHRANWDSLANLSGLLMFGLAGVWLMHAYGPLGTALALLLYTTTAMTVRLGVFVRLTRPQAVRIVPAASQIPPAGLTPAVSLEDSASMP
jgi:O-antigen/teichoic acid export membrane protein